MGFNVPPNNQAIDSPISMPQVDIQEVMKRVYLWMTLGLGITGVIALFISSTPSLWELFYNPVVMILTIIPMFGIAIAIPAGMTRKWLTPGLAATLFVVYASIMGVFLSSIFLAYAEATIGAALLVTTTIFVVMSVFGYTTKMDLTKWGTYLFMGLIALIIVMFINLLLQSSAISWMISVAGVIIFTAMTAYDTQKIKNMSESFEVQGDGSLAAKVSIYGALVLYLDFINLFLFLLRIMGGGRD